ncbi:MAG: ChaN family lipoprotein [Polyangiales bacterium]
MPSPRALLPILAWTFAACGPVATPSAAVTPSTTVRLPPFSGDRDRDHALVGKWFEPATSRFVQLDAVLARAVATPLVGIGETHDDADHHAVEALILRTMIGRGRRPAVVLEMVDEDRQAAIDEGRARRIASADDFAILVDWTHSGWPAFDLYRPIVAATLDAKLPLLAGNPSRATTRALVRHGRASLAAGEWERLLLDRVWEPSTEASLRQELVDDHCGMVSAGSPMIDGMVLAERARDASFAHHMIAARGDGAVLFAGSGHVRNDRGVPWALRSLKSSQAMFTLGLIEVEKDKADPTDYAARFVTARLPFDVVLFTPSPTRTDPCAAMTPSPPPIPKP